MVIFRNHGLRKAYPTFFTPWVYYTSTTKNFSWDTPSNVRVKFTQSVYQWAFFNIERGGYLLEHVTTVKGSEVTGEDFRFANGLSLELRLVLSENTLITSKEENASVEDVISNVLGSVVGLLGTFGSLLAMIEFVQMKRRMYKRRKTGLVSPPLSPAMVGAGSPSMKPLALNTRANQDNLSSPSMKPLTRVNEDNVTGVDQKEEKDSDDKPNTKENEAKKEDKPKPVDDKPKPVDPKPVVDDKPKPVEEKTEEKPKEPSEATKDDSKPEVMVTEFTSITVITVTEEGK
jgi:hypothetical protein